ncbi:hypothetical protein GOBAR_AA12499 [Gossypium barbadense]|uniref:Uncharacterized protein n=1 Tax=Gossypium barbadense TaxID=3634 RepID=A0A2P5XXT5_GOSBA|nr:hypothetical protein GOBAR_AA12499 [Gossypium barbadense]
MGNCSLKGVTAECRNSIRVLTDGGEIIDVKGPKLARDIANDFPGYVICKRDQTQASMFPLNEGEWLVNGGFYYLLPLDKVGAPKMSMAAADFVENLSSGSAMEVLPWKKNGVWKVKLVINSSRLEDILSEQVNTEALIEKMRMAAATATPKRSKGSRLAVGCKPAYSKAS